MNRTATLFVALIVVVASAAVAPAVATQADTPTSTATSTAQAENGTANESDGDNVAPGAMLSGVVGVQGAEIDGEVESRTFGIEVAKANTDDAKARVVAEQYNDSEARLTELREGLDSLEAARENGSIGEDQYAARAARLQTEVNTVQRLSNETAAVSESIPRKTLEANGVNVTAIEALRQNAGNMTGPEVAAIARTIAGPGAGQGMAPDRAGGPGDRPSDDRAVAVDRADGDDTGPNDGTDGNETATTTESDGGGDAESSAADGSESDERGR